MRISLIGLIFAAVAWGYPMTPNGKVTPGGVCTASDPDFTEYRYPERIPYCDRQVSSSLKKHVYELYRIAEKDRKDYTIDHLIPLSLGGNNRKPNLWPEHREVKALRPKLEYELYVKLRSGSLSQEDAIETIMWAKFHPTPEREIACAR